MYIDAYINIYSTNLHYIKLKGLFLVVCWCQLNSISTGLTFSEATKRKRSLGRATIVTCWRSTTLTRVGLTGFGWDLQQLSRGRRFLPLARLRCHTGRLIGLTNRGRRYLKYDTGEEVNHCKVKTNIVTCIIVHISNVNCISIPQPKKSSRLSRSLLTSRSIQLFGCGLGREWKQKWFETPSYIETKSKGTGSV